VRRHQQTIDFTRNLGREIKPKKRVQSGPTPQSYQPNYALTEPKRASALDMNRQIYWDKLASASSHQPKTLDRFYDVNIDVVKKRAPSGTKFEDMLGREGQTRIHMRDPAEDDLEYAPNHAYLEPHRPTVVMSKQLSRTAGRRSQSVEPSSSSSSSRHRLGAASSSAAANRSLKFPTPFVQIPDFKRYSSHRVEKPKAVNESRGYTLPPSASAVSNAVAMDKRLGREVPVISKATAGKLNDLSYDVKYEMSTKDKRQRSANFSNTLGREKPRAITRVKISPLDALLNDWKAGKIASDAQSALKKSTKSSGVTNRRNERL
jgi:hypothetical protein